MASRARLLRSALVTLATGWCGFTAEARVVNGFDLSDAAVPVAEIRHGGPPRDGIPAIDRPRFVDVDKAGFLDVDDRVLGVTLDGVARAYPVPILDRHEIVNDWTEATDIAVTYCPLCGSGVVFRADGRRFGVSGLLYNSDVLLYDDRGESLWSQLLGQAITGPDKGASLTTLPVVHTTWGAWRAQHPDTLVLSRRTGYRMRYDGDAYPGYQASTRTMFRVAHRDDRYHPKEWVLGVTIGDASKVYPYAELRQATTPFPDRVGDESIVVHFDADSATAWLDGSEAAQSASVRAFWFAWIAFHPGTEVFVASSLDARE